MNVGKFGLKPVIERPKLKLSQYVDAAKLPVINSPVRWTMALMTDWGMMGNDSVGDCFWAAAAHAFMTWTANSGIQASFTDQQVLAAYSAATGYDPSDPATDQGTDLIQGMNFLKKTGIAGYKTGPYIEVPLDDMQLVHSAHWIFGGMLVGVEFHKDWEQRVIWDISSSPVLGGHMVYSGDYFTGPDKLGIVTWGEDRFLTTAALKAYGVAIVTVPEAWIADNGLAPSGFALQDLLADEAKL